MRTLIVLAMLLGVVVSAQAVDAGEVAGEIDVSTNADAMAVKQHTDDFLMTIFPCLLQTSQGGKSDAEAEAYCFCKNRSLVESHLADLKQFYGKHPEWNGKTLKIVSNSAGAVETTRLKPGLIEEIEDSLKKAPKTCK